MEPYIQVVSFFIFTRSGRGSRGMMDNRLDYRTSRNRLETLKIFLIEAFRKYTDDTHSKFLGRKVLSLGLQKMWKGLNLQTSSIDSTSANDSYQCISFSKTTTEEVDFQFLYFF
ncbi:hypothetical protein CEXT_584271 [Caerostris extrusa]|uniref:Uncharacterized protein n=1 Tax=Caerostris extrusa TaxID=172846 RepID=A0AAV4RRJ2_CAEEX|nr:hypothetical protein CEXT_584271 [Caerostris extrusa]